MTDAQLLIAVNTVWVVSRPSSSCSQAGFAMVEAGFNAQRTRPTS